MRQYMTYLDQYTCGSCTPNCSCGGSCWYNYVGPRSSDLKTKPNWYKFAVDSYIYLKDKAICESTDVSKTESSNNESNASITYDNVMYLIDKTRSDDQSRSWLLEVNNGKYEIPDTAAIDRVTGNIYYSKESQNAVDADHKLYYPNMRFYYTQVYTPTAFNVKEKIKDAESATKRNAFSILDEELKSIFEYNDYSIHVDIDNIGYYDNKNDIKLECYYNVINRLFTDNTSGGIKVLDRPINIGIKDAMFPKRSPRWNWTVDKASDLIKEIESTPSSVIYSNDKLEYEIKLSPSDIKAIRTYNKENNYAVYDFSCNQINGQCTSNSLTTWGVIRK